MHFTPYRYCKELNKVMGGSIDFGKGTLTTKQCTGYVPHKPSWYDVERLIPNLEQSISSRTFKVQG